MATFGFSPLAILEQTVAVAETVGYVSLKEASVTGKMSSKDAVWARLTGAPAAPPTDAQKATAATLLAFALALPGKTDYESSVTDICRREKIGYGPVGFVVSVYGCFKAYSERKSETAAAVAAPSAHVGKVGERFTFDAKCFACFPYESQFGQGNVLKFKDAAGNVFVWFTTARSVKSGTLVKVTGTVKAHDTYRDVPQTVLTRCRVEEAAVEEVAPAVAAA